MLIAADATFEEKFRKDGHLIAIYQQKKLKYPIQISTYIILISL
jgi:hypothetical protein